MRIIAHKKFRKQFVKLSTKQQIQVNKAILVFKYNPNYPLLKNHKLQGKLKGNRAISVGNDLRIIFREEKNYYIVYMLYVGTHNQVY